jgi:hypothetical protein
MWARCSTKARAVPEGVAAAALAIVFDGLDNQVSGAFTIMRDWNVPRSALTPALTSGFVGTMFGGSSAAWSAIAWAGAALLGSLISSAC